MNRHHLKLLVLTCIVGLMALLYSRSVQTSPPRAHDPVARVD